jgi:hypothetical protein
MFLRRCPNGRFLTLQIQEGSSVSSLPSSWSLSWLRLSRLAREDVVCLPFGSFSDAMTIVRKDFAACKKMEWKAGDEPAVCFTVLMYVGEPYYKRMDEGGKKEVNADVDPTAESSPLLVELIQIPLCFLEKTEAYFGDHGIKKSTSASRSGTISKRSIH